MCTPSSSSSSSIPSSIPRRVEADCPIVVPEVWEHALEFLNIKELTSVGALSHQMADFCAVEDVWARCLASVRIRPGKDALYFAKPSSYARGVWHEARNVHRYVETLNASLPRAAQIPHFSDPILQSHALVEFIRNNSVISRELFQTYVEDGFTAGIDAVFAGRDNFEAAHRIHLAELGERRSAINAAIVAARAARDPEAEHEQSQAFEQIVASITAAESRFEGEKWNYIQLSLKRALASAIAKGDLATVQKIWAEIERCGGEVIHSNSLDVRIMKGFELGYLIESTQKPEIFAFIITKIGNTHPSIDRAFALACETGNFRAAWVLRHFYQKDSGSIREKIVEVLRSNRYAPHEQSLLLEGLFQELLKFKLDATDFRILFIDCIKFPCMASPCIVEFFLRNPWMEQYMIFFYGERFTSQSNYSAESLQVFIRYLEPFKGCLQRAQAENPALKERLDAMLIPQNWSILKKIAEQNPDLTDPRKLEELLLHELPKPSTSSAAETPTEIERGFLEAVKNGNKSRFEHYFKYVETMSPEVRCKAYIASLKWMDNAMEVQLRKYVPGWRKLFLEHRRMH